MRKLKIACGLTVVLVVGWFLFATASIYKPYQGDVDTRTDAIVSLSPPPYRLPLAQELYADDRADHLVISYVPMNLENHSAEWAAAWEPADSYCEDGSGDSGEHVWCLSPEDISTRGEALAMQELAEEQGWDDVTVVTSKSHVFRTRFIFQQCAGDVDINVVYPEPDLTVKESGQSWGVHIVYENAAFFKAIYETTFKC